jgi:hypothetical protein
MGRFFKSSEPTPADAIAGDTIHSVGGDVEKAGETLHDEGDDGPQQPIDPAVEKRVVRKLDRNVVPLVMALYLLAYLDRSNVGLVLSLFYVVCTFFFLILTSLGGPGTLVLLAWTKIWTSKVIVTIGSLLFFTSPILL